MLLLPNREGQRGLHALFQKWKTRRGYEILHFPNFHLVRKRVYLKEGGIFHPSSGVV
jgi:hypothetical protein